MRAGSRCSVPGSSDTPRCSACGALAGDELYLLTRTPRGGSAGRAGVAQGGTWENRSRAPCRLARMPVGGSLVILMELSSSPCGMMCVSGLGAGSALMNSRYSGWLSRLWCSTSFSSVPSHRATRWMFCKRNSLHLVNLTSCPPHPDSYCGSTGEGAEQHEGAWAGHCSSPRHWHCHRQRGDHAWALAGLCALVCPVAIRAVHPVLCPTALTHLQDDPVALCSCHLHGVLCHNLLALPQGYVVDLPVVNGETQPGAWEGNVCCQYHLGPCSSGHWASRAGASLAWAVPHPEPPRPSAGQHRGRG